MRENRLRTLWKNGQSAVNGWLAIPNGFTSERMPTSLQILCHAGAESMALRIGWAFEQATGGVQHPPEP